MRRSLITILAAVFAMACADMPTTPLLTATDASFERAPVPDYPPPPFATVDGTAETAYGTVTFVAHFFANKPGNVAWLQFKSGSAVFSANARIMSNNGTVSGIGTITLAGGVVDLSKVTVFNYLSYRATNALSFSGGDISSGSAWLKRGGDEACLLRCVITDGGGQ